MTTEAPRLTPKEGSAVLTAVVARPGVALRTASDLSLPPRSWRLDSCRYHSTCTRAT